MNWSVDFDQAPFLAIWETTQACPLACRHCRASAMPGPMAGELSTPEGKRVIDAVASMGTPLMVLSGGDPLSRPDIVDLVRHGKQRGLRMAAVPAASDRLTEDAILRLRDAGLDQIAVSIDFPDEQRHDAFRGSPGSFRRSLQAIEWSARHGIPSQINTCVWSESARSLESMGELAKSLGIVFWEVFFLVPTGRGVSLTGLTPEECESCFGILQRVQARESFILKVTEAPHYRRYLRQHQDAEHGRVSHPGATGGVPMARRGVNAGNGFVFISHLGEIYPSGFLPISAGNVRSDRLMDVYRGSSLFRRLRDPLQLKDRCGRCPFATLCGGSRSRAYALTGDPFESDPWCGYEPS